jgi:hypothetical protein
MWWKLAGLGLIEAALLLLLTLPIQTHAVMYDTAELARGHETEIFGQTAIAIGGLVTMIIAIGTPIWLAYRVIRRAGPSN